VAVTPSGTVDPNTPGTYTITYTATDPSHNTQTATRTVNVVDTTPPTITTCPPATATVFAGVNCQGTVPDLRGAVVASDNCTSTAGLIVTQVPAPGTLVALSPPTTTITVIVTDGSGNSSSCQTTLTVTNDAPVVTTVTGPTAPLALGSSATVAAQFTDTGIQGHVCTFSWDDGSPDSQVTVGAGVSSCSANHLYAAAGVNTVSVTVTDDCGASSDPGIFQFVVIYDPDAGFVTGGGFINSTAGAYVANPALTGKANFGFVSKYQKGAKVPTGETEFQFQVASFDFHSSAYEWLVISGALAQYKGTGTVNGSGNYGFLLTATDGQVSGGGGVDKFRIKIWNNDAGGAIVYDNRLGSSDDINSANPQAIAGGSIVIHKN
jgi:hypothetical protein